MSNLTLRRADLLKLTDMTARPFDAMLLRDQAPWGKRDTGREWGTFTTEDAYRVALVHALVRQGRSYEDAGRLVRVEFGGLLKVTSPTPGDLLLGTFMTEERPQDEAGVRLHLSFVATETEWFSELLRMKNLVSVDDELIAFSAVNATAVMRRTLTLANTTGLIDGRLTRLAKKVRAL